MGVIDQKGIQEAFKKEAQGLINKIKKELGGFKNDSRFTIHDSRIFRLFRYAHTLKGISGTCGFYKIESAAKSITEIFRAAKDEKVVISLENKVTIKKNLKVCEELLKKIKGQPMKKSEYTGKVSRKLIIDTNRRLQEASQKLFLAKQELEKHNEQLQRELNILKHLAGRDKTDDKGLRSTEGVPEKKLTRVMAEDLSLRYIHLLESYVKSKDLDKDESLVEELCLKLMECGVTPKGIISIHLKAVPQIKTIGDLETKRVTFESRMVLLKVMTQYASLLLRKNSS